MGPIGVPELIFIFVLALLIFGPRKLPELGRNLGKALAEFRRASTDLRRTVEDEMRNLEDEARQLERQASDLDSNGNAAPASAGSGSIAPPATEPPRYEEKPPDGDVKPV